MSEKLRVHLDTQTGKAPYMQIGEPAWSEAAARHAAATSGLDVSFTADWQGVQTALADADVLICQAVPPVDLAQSAPRLKWVMATSAGVEAYMPLDWLPAGVRFTNNSGAHAPKAREFGAMALAMLHYRVPRLQSAQRARIWAPHFSPLIAGRTVVIAGFGALGRATAESARAIGLRVVAVRRNPAPDPLADAVFPPERLVEACRGADFLVSALPLTPGTRGMVGAAAFDALNPEAGVVNIGRAGVMDYAALCARLDDGRISGAILDVFDPEPLPADDPLWAQQNLTIMPHMSSDDPTAYIQRSLDVFFQNLAAFRAGADKLPNEVDRTLGY